MIEENRQRVDFQNLKGADFIRAITGNISTNISPFDLLRLAGGITYGEFTQ